MEVKSGHKENRTCLIVNSSDKSSSNAKIENYTGIFGEVYFENRGTIPIREIEITKCSFKMRKGNNNILEDFSLNAIGKLEVNIRQESPFKFLLCYLYDNNENMLCDPRYTPNGSLHAEAVKKKRMYDNQLRCYLPVIIDLYEKLSFSFKLTAQDGRVYEQNHTIEIKLRGEGGTYTPKADKPRLLK